MKIFFALAISMSILYSCKSSKSGNTAFQRTQTATDQPSYNSRQNFTTKYNILFNAKSMLEQEAEAIFHTSQKNYQIRQQLFDEPTGHGEAYQLMDSLIQKAYKIINDKQESKYVSEAYFLAGQANYYKGSYHTAIEFFNQVVRAALKEQRQQIAPAYAWKSRALLQIGKIQQAKLAIDSAMMTLDDDKHNRTLVNASLANYYLRIQEPIAAIPYLEYALESNRNLNNKYRWTFLLAQLYKESGEQEKAFTYFKKIARSNVPYDMSFEADLQAAFLEGSKYATIEDQIKPLKKMLREGKNDGYQDQILYQIGDIYYEAGQHELGLQYFNKSLRETKRNPYQATESYLKLADYYFQSKKYQVAEQYFDSVAMYLPEDYTDINKLRRKLSYMHDIIDRYKIVVWQDTLLHYASLHADMLEKELEEQALKLAIYHKEELDRKKKLDGTKKKNKVTERVQHQSPFLTTMHPSTNWNSNSDQTFYFNNPDELLMGQSAFKRRWGNRQLKDNWRYEADLTASLPSRDNETNISIGNIVSDEFDENQFITSYKNKYLSQLPKTQEAYEAAHELIHDNLISIGNIYRDYTRDNHDAIAVYEEVLRRYPESSQAPALYYSLYRMYADNNPTKSTNYLAKLIQLYPNSIHAKVGQDPSYMDKINRDKKLLDRIFERLYTLYANGDHAAVINLADENLKERFENTTLMAQVEYLRALAIGRVGSVMDFQHELNEIVRKYPDNILVTPLAKENLNFIAQYPTLFVNRVNALQDGDKNRISFVDEPDMTPWPALSIAGDYRSGIALVKELPKSIDEQSIPSKKLVVAKVEEIKMEDVRSKAEEVVQVVEQKVEEKKEVEIAEEKKIAVVVDVKKEEVKKEEVLKVANIETMSLEKGQASISKGLAIGTKLAPANMNLLRSEIDFGPNDYRDKELFPDTAEYYFVINVEDAKVNLAPSRYGIGQFNRTRFTQTKLNHHLNVINGENQLLLIGAFRTYEEVKAYESRISTLMPEIMKIPVEIYNTFVITKDALPLLTDGVEIKKYYQNYTEQ